ncbi:hypothetical protein GCM10010339_70640 [Streptomyces alanosinicus]|uniref:Uncharacterized protein n=1 Tax=Streptomyces alanosinicus TaxID=68171 RepID=A0A919D650_9ACTN|nr:hypothetical protein GCM10010339_70640 [Streptomyces alanosinicus]
MEIVCVGGKPLRQQLHHARKQVWDRVLRYAVVEEERADGEGHGHASTTCRLALGGAAYHFSERLAVHLAVDVPDV